MSKGLKFDEGKPPISLLPREAVEQVALVMARGAEKYSAENWREVRPGARYLDAALRHIFAHSSGETVDRETRLLHLAHAASCLLILIGLHREGVSTTWRDEEKI